MKIKKYALIILFYGVLWGLFEFILGGYLLFIGHPLGEIIMRTIGFIILGICAFKHRTIFSLLGIGIIAMCFKTFNVLTCCLTLLSPGIINPMIGILGQTIVVTIISFVIIRTKSFILLKQQMYNYAYNKKEGVINNKS